MKRISSILHWNASIQVVHDRIPVLKQTNFEAAYSVCWIRMFRIQVDANETESLMETCRAFTFTMISVV